MRKAIGSAALAAMLSMGIGTTAVAHASGVRTTASAQYDDDKNDDDGIGDKVGLFGLVGLLGLAGLIGRGGGKSKGGGGGYGGVKAPKGKASKGGHTTDWSSR